MARDQTISMLASLRLAIGIGAWTTPRLAGRILGLDVDGNPQAPYLARLFGVRDAALAVGALTSDGDAQIQWLRAGIACDIADAAAGAAAWRAGYLPAPTSAMVTAIALAAAALGRRAMREA